MYVFLSFIKSIPRRILQLLQTYLFVYLILKLQIFNNFKEFNDPLYQAFFSLMLLIPTILIVPVLLIFYFTLRIYKFLVIQYISFKLGPEFDGGLVGNDAIFASNIRKSEMIVNTVAAVQYPGQDFFDRAKAQVQLRLQGKKVERLFSTRESIGGFGYFRKSKFDVDDYVRSFDITSNKVGTKEELEEALSNLANAPLPKKNKATWEVLIGNQPVLWDNHKEQRIFLFRVHHVVGDGVTIYKILVAIFADVASTKNLFPTTLKPEKSLVTASFAFEVKILLSLWIDFLKFIANIHLKYRGTKDYEYNNFVHGPELTGVKQVIWKVEKDAVYVQRIKDIKNRLPGTTFNDVLFTAISASIASFFNKEGKVHPSHIQASFPIYKKPNNLGHYEATDLETLTMENNFLFAFIDLPMFEEGTCGLAIESTLLDRLENLKKEFLRVKQSMDLQLNHFCSETLLNIMTPGMLEVLFASDEQTMSISTTPGNRALTSFSAHVTDVIYYTPHVRRLGIGLTLMTYDSRCQFGLMVDKAILKEKRQLHLILNGITNYIDLLDKSTKIQNL